MHRCFPTMYFRLYILRRSIRLAGTNHYVIDDGDLDLPQIEKEAIALRVSTEDAVTRLNDSTSTQLSSQEPWRALYSPFPAFSPAADHQPVSIFNNISPDRKRQTRPTDPSPAFNSAFSAPFPFSSSDRRPSEEMDLQRPFANLQLGPVNSPDQTLANPEAPRSPSPPRTSSPRYQKPQSYAPAGTDLMFFGNGSCDSSAGYCSTVMEVRRQAPRISRH